MEEVSGSFEGMGMEIGLRNDILTVIAPLEGTPAKKAGILPGDKIIKIDGVATTGLTEGEAIKKIRGKGGTTVALSLLRDIGTPGKVQTKSLEVSVVRAPIDIPTIKTEARPDGVFVISLYNFSAPSANLFRDALREFKSSKSDKLLIDLRGNPGGYLESAVDIASFFLPIGDTVVRESQGEGKPEIVHKSKGYDINLGSTRIALLIDRGSASASEILAGALSESGVATLIGEKSFGKGSVQELIPISDGTSVKITVAKWLTPKGLSISENGLTPKIPVPYSDTDRVKGTDPQLARAVVFLKTGK
jgi:carboxyl-terminal processing protease